MKSAALEVPAADAGESNGRYIILNSEIEFWNNTDGWVRQIAEATSFEDTNYNLPLAGQFFYLEGNPREIQSHYYLGEDDDRESVASFEEADGFCVFVGIYNGEERTDIPKIFHRDFPKCRSGDPEVLAYIEMLQSRLGPLDEDYF